MPDLLQRLMYYAQMRHDHHPNESAHESREHNEFIYRQECAERYQQRITAINALRHKWQKKVTAIGRKSEPDRPDAKVVAQAALNDLNELAVALEQIYVNRDAEAQDLPRREDYPELFDDADRSQSQH